MKNSFLGLLFFVSTFGASQEVVVLNKRTKAAIPYASVEFLNGSGISSNKEGKFVFKKKDIDSVKITSLGFKPTLINTKQMLNEGVVF